jgi:hypothetical protein
MLLPTQATLPAANADVANVTVTAAIAKKSNFLITIV